MGLDSFQYATECGHNDGIPGRINDNTAHSFVHHLTQSHLADDQAQRALIVPRSSAMAGRLASSEIALASSSMPFMAVKASLIPGESARMTTSVSC